MAAAAWATVSIAAAPAARGSCPVVTPPANARLSCSFLGCGSVAGGSFLPAAALWQCRLPIQHEKARFCVTAAALDDEVEMSPEEITRAYEALYGPSWDRKKSTEATSGMGDDEEKGPGRGRGRRGDDVTGRRTGPGGGAKDGLEESVVQVRRVTKVVKGGKQLSFRVVSVVGDKKGKVGVGVGKAKEVIAAVQKSVKDARRHMVIVPMTKYKTFPHRADGHYGAADVMLRPASPGTGVIAGGSVRIVLEMAGIVNALGKEMGSDNCLNNARATLHAVSQMRHYKEVAELRGIPVEQLYR